MSNILCIILLINSYTVSCVSNWFDLYKLEGRYTRHIPKYHLVIPRRVNSDGSFLTYKLPYVYSRDTQNTRFKRKPSETIHLQIDISGDTHHLELEPNRDFLAPNLIVENYDKDPLERKTRQVEQKQCHYTGSVRGYNDSTVAVSLCDSLTGLVATERGQYLVEPVHGHGANLLGQHLHVVHRRETSTAHREHSPTPTGVCGTKSNWTTAWADRFWDQFANSVEDDVHRQHRESNTEDKRKTLKISMHHRYVEVLLVADKKFLEWHKDIDYEAYLLTLMNVVSNYYHDASVGLPIDIVVGRIIYLKKEEEEIDLDISTNADASLDSFCKWQQRINFPQNHPNHHDIAVLITRHDICSADDKTGNCGLMGLAYVSGVCDPKLSCSINQDSGLELSVVITHEIGHLLGSAHDAEGESNCTAQQDDGFYNIMSPFVKVATTSWSVCSRAFIRALINSGLGECLLNEPAGSNYKYIDVLPGVVYDADFQCKGMPSKLGACGFKDCTSLRCYITEKKCGSYVDQPPFDGTSCGQNKWCFKKECVEIGERPTAVDGGWGEWSSWSECSRTCGGGISISERECNNPPPAQGGMYCLGEKTQVKFCNKEACKPDSISFKDYQCGLHNTKSIEMINFSPPGKLDPCHLYCLEVPDGPYHKYPAADGTRCKPGTRNVCVHNACQKVGCDFEFGSDAEYDHCGICKGDGTECEEIKGIYNQSPEEDVEYEEAFSIPKGARSIHIAEIDKSPSYIMLTTDPNEGDPEILLNDVSEQEDDEQKDILGSQVVYIHQQTGIENIWIYEPINANLFVWVVIKEHSNPGYTYSYTIPAPKSKYKPVYYWEMLETTPCSAQCGGGTSEIIPKCVEKIGGKVDASYCSDLPKPKVVSVQCNIEPCKTKWVIGDWEPCTGCKHQIGFSRRDIECVSESRTLGGDDVLEESEKCKDKSPHRMELCVTSKPCGNSSIDNYSRNILSDLWFQANKEYVKSFNQLAPKLKFYKVDEDKKENKDKIINRDCSKHLEENYDWSKKNFGKLIRDYDGKDNSYYEEITTKKMPQLNLNILDDNLYEEVGGDIAIMESTTEEPQNCSIQIKEGD